eukprot:augustus_masked-scaffold_13-processed-gene-1.2-mRNA-1 protein AED:0.42 eAED:0.42 QI:0/-1/0/1/-1/1/1/0/601
MVLTRTQLKKQKEKEKVQDDADAITPVPYTSVSSNKNSKKSPRKNAKTPAVEEEREKLDGPKIKGNGKSKTPQKKSKRKSIGGTLPNLELEKIEKTIKKTQEQSKSTERKPVKAVELEVQKKKSNTSISKKKFSSLKPKVNNLSKKIEKETILEEPETVIQSNKPKRKSVSQERAKSDKNQKEAQEKISNKSPKSQDPKSRKTSSENKATRKSKRKSISSQTKKDPKEKHDKKSDPPKRGKKKRIHSIESSKPISNSATPKSESSRKLSTARETEADKDLIGKSAAVKETSIKVVNMSPQPVKQVFSTPRKDAAPQDIISAILSKPTKQEIYEKRLAVGGGVKRRNGDSFPASQQYSKRSYIPYHPKAFVGLQIVKEGEEYVKVRFRPNKNKKRNSKKRKRAYISGKKHKKQKRDKKKENDEPQFLLLSDNDEDKMEVDDSFNFTTIIHNKTAQEDVGKKAVSAIKPTADKKKGLKSLTLSVMQDDKPLHPKKSHAQREQEKSLEWGALKSADMTEEAKINLEALQMRGALDPKRHYKSNDTSELPSTFQFGKVIAGKFESRNEKMGRKEVKGSIVDELLGNKASQEYLTRVANEVKFIGK